MFTGNEETIMENKVLICDDSVAVHRSLGRYLQKEGIETLSAFTGEDALEMIRKDQVSLIVLDIMLPGMSGLDLCREIRKSDPDIYILMLSAKGEEMDRIIGLELGGDDYMTKPFSPRELSVKIRNVLARRKKQKSPAAKDIAFDKLVIDPSSYRAYVDSNYVELTQKELGVLELLIQNTGKVISREQIIEAVWGYDYNGDIRAVDSLMKRLKQKLKEAGETLPLKSVYGVGYRLERIHEEK